MKKRQESQKVVRTFSLASFLNDLGSDMIYPIWPLFVTEVLGANMAVLGFIDGLGNALVSISQAISGHLSDKLGKRKLFIWLGYLFGSMSRVGYSLSTMWQHLIPFKILDRFGKMRGAPRDAMVADVSTKENRGRNFGLLRMMDKLGAVFGTILSIFLITRIDYRSLFMLAAIPSVIGAILIMVLIKERKTKKLSKGYSFRNLSKNFKLFLLLSSIFALGSFSYSFLLIYAKNSGFQSAFILFFYLIFTVTAALSSLPFGKLADKIGRKSVILISYVIFGVMCLGFIFLNSYWGIFLLFVLYGLHQGSFVPVQKTFVSELSPKDLRASSIGGYQMVIGLCALPASFVAGLLWDKVGMYFPFYFSLGLTTISIVLLHFVKED